MTEKEGSGRLNRAKKRVNDLLELNNGNHYDGCRYESQKDQLMQQQMNVDQVAFAKEQAKDTKNQVQAMTQAKKELKAEFKRPELNLDNVESLQDELDDILDQSNEMQEILGRSYDAPEDINDEVRSTPFYFL